MRWNDKSFYSAPAHNQMVIKIELDADKNILATNHLKRNSKYIWSCNGDYLDKKIIWVTPPINKWKLFFKIFSNILDARAWPKGFYELGSAFFPFDCPSFFPALSWNWLIIFSEALVLGAIWRCAWQNPILGKIRFQQKWPKNGQKLPKNVFFCFTF